MSKKKFGVKNFFLSFIVGCVVIYIFQYYNNSVDIVTVEKGTLEDIIEAKGVIVKNEDVFVAPSNGSVTTHRKEGERISRGVLVADLNTSADSNNIKESIAEIDMAMKSKKDEEAKPKVQLTSEQLGKYKDDIQSDIVAGKLDKLYNIEEQLSGNDSVKFSNNSYADYDMTDLKTMRANLVKNLSTNKIPYYSKQPGIVSYKTDGLENRYKYENVMELTASSINIAEYSEIDSSKNTSVSANQGVLKVIDNFDYYVAAIVDNDYSTLFEEKTSIKTRIKASDGTEQVVWGYIVKINYGSEETVLIINFDEYFQNIYDKRYVTIDLITDVYEGLKITNKAVVNKNEIDGVYIKSKGNIATFMPVKILGKNEEYTIISEGNTLKGSRGSIDLYGEVHNTVKVFDSVITEPNKVYDGEIID